MSKQKKLLIPELRFPEFRNKGEWVKKKIGNITQVTAGATPSTSIAEYWGGQIPWMNSGELNLKRVFNVDNRITELGLIKTSTKLIPPGCILIGLAGQGKTRGTAAINYIELCTNQSIASIHPNKDKFCSEFMFQQMDFMYYHLRTLSKGEGGRGGLNISIIKSINISLPSIPEQKKIADCLESIDELITLHKQKHEKLRAYRISLMQQLFPAAGEVLPKFRFPEFRNEGPWKLKSIGSVLIEKQRPINMEDDIEYSLVTVKRRYGGLISRGIYKGKTIKVKSQFEVQENDFLISKRQIVHCACGVVPKELDKSIVSNEYSVLVPRKGNDIFFFDYFAQQPSVGISFLRCSIGIVIEKMLFKLKNWLKEEFLFPGLEEQKKIAQFLKDLDSIINQQSQKVEMLKEHKKGLIQKLLPAIDGAE
ncbi:restriction endonuclease subunit S [Rouxiella badensis]|uniref:restriction endonuclease subunit S n=1 Tax=Rouxiella badensis TaxID=1646377 RepID=UPI001D1337E7|nr:restriction endonuclease subunit S [Rouxiella badensis]MCC3721397.1 restriction endonuclease subunit S [Rouxiella badensis]MCC3731086.1 restriction endonuclease subunit S [Rouxiella badensis]